MVAGGVGAVLQIGIGLDAVGEGDVGVFGHRHAQAIVAAEGDAVGILFVQDHATLAGDLQAIAVMLVLDHHLARAGKELGAADIADIAIACDVGGRARPAPNIAPDDPRSLLEPSPGDDIDPVPRKIGLARISMLGAEPVKPNVREVSFAELELQLQIILITGRLILRCLWPRRLRRGICGALPSRIDLGPIAIGGPIA